MLADAKLLQSISTTSLVIATMWQTKNSRHDKWPTIYVWVELTVFGWTLSNCLLNSTRSGYTCDTLSSKDAHKHSLLEFFSCTRMFDILSESYSPFKKAFPNSAVFLNEADAFLNRKRTSSIAIDQTSLTPPHLLLCYIQFLTRLTLVISRS